MAVDTNVSGVAARSIGSAPRVGDVMPVKTRLSDRGETFTRDLTPGLRGLAAEGSYFTGTATGTIDTGINLSIATGTSFTSSQCMLVIYNAEPAGGRSVELDYFKIVQLTAMGAGATAWQVMHFLDWGNRYSSGGTAMAINNSMGGAGPGTVYAWAGAVVATNATGVASGSALPGAAVLMDRTQIMNGIGVTRIVLTMKYAGEDCAPSFNTPTTTATTALFGVAPIIIPPGMSYVANEWQVGRVNTVGTGEFYLGFSFR